MKRMSYLQKVARSHGATQVLVPPRRFWTPAESPGIEERTVSADAGDRGVSRKSAAAPGRQEQGMTAPRRGRSGPPAARAEDSASRHTKTGADAPRPIAPREPAATFAKSVNAPLAPAELETAPPREAVARITARETPATARESAAAAIDRGEPAEGLEPVTSTLARKAMPIPEPASPRHSTEPRRSRIRTKDDATRESASRAARHSRDDGSLAAGAALSTSLPDADASAIEAGTQPRSPLPPGAVSRATPAPASRGDAEAVSSDPGAPRAVPIPLSPVAVSEPIAQTPASRSVRATSRGTFVPVDRGDADAVSPELGATNAPDAMFAQPMPPARAAAATPRRNAAMAPAAEREARGGGDRSREEDERVEVRIGSIDVRVEPEPRRAPRPATPAPARPLARGFVSSFGLRQG